VLLCVTLCVTVYLGYIQQDRAKSDTVTQESLKKNYIKKKEKRKKNKVYEITCYCVTLKPVLSSFIVVFIIENMQKKRLYYSLCFIIPQMIKHHSKLNQ